MAYKALHDFLHSMPILFHITLSFAPYTLVTVTFFHSPNFPNVFPTWAPLVCCPHPWSSYSSFLYILQNLDHTNWQSVLICHSSHFILSPCLLPHRLCNGSTTDCSPAGLHRMQANNFPGIKDVVALIQQDGTERLLDNQWLPHLLWASLLSEGDTETSPEQRGSWSRLRSPHTDWDAFMKPKVQVTATFFLSRSLSFLWMRHGWCWA